MVSHEKFSQRKTNAAENAGKVRVSRKRKPGET